MIEDYIKNLTWLFFLSLLIIKIVNCSEDDESTTVTENAFIIWGGEYAVDGCGFVVEIDGKNYKPENEDTISDEYKITKPIEVILTFQYLNRDIEYFCGIVPIKSEGIKVISISKL